LTVYRTVFSLRQLDPVCKALRLPAQYILTERLQLSFPLLSVVSIYGVKVFGQIVADRIFGKPCFLGYLHQAETFLAQNRTLPARSSSFCTASSCSRPRTIGFSLEISLSRISRYCLTVRAERKISFSHLLISSWLNGKPFWRFADIHKFNKKFTIYTFQIHAAKVFLNNYNQHNLLI